MTPSPASPAGARAARGRPPIARTARDALGIATLHHAQRRAIDSLLAGRATLAIAATGYGKSAIYQVAGLLREGPTVVVSPLIALQQDQVDAIEERLPGAAAALNSALGARARTAIERRLAEGTLRFVLVAPEQLARPATLGATRMTGQEDQAPQPAGVPLGRARDAREVGALVAWLCSDQASYVTGASYVVDGGLMLIAADPSSPQAAGARGRRPVREPWVRRTPARPRRRHRRRRA